MRFLIIPFLTTLSCSCSTVDTNSLRSTGIRQYHNDSLQEAIKTFSIALKSNDTCWDCLLYRGFSYKEIEEFDNYDSSLIDFNKAYKLDSSKTYLNPICHMLYATGQKDSACLIYTKLVNLGDTSFDKGLVEYFNNYR